MNTLIDTHCHLNYEYEGKTTDDLLREGRDAGVATFITIAADPADFEVIQKISEAHENVYHTIGVHPHDASKVDDAVLRSIRTFGAHKKCVAIGEIGLDYFYEHSDRAKQQAEVRAQLLIALDLQKPVVIHSRDGEEDLLPILTEYAKQCVVSPGVIHCFSGTDDFARACLDLGFYISLSGIITFKNSETLRQMVRNFPIDRLLVETDAPYLAPIPMRGKKCEPAMVKHTAMKLAEVMGMDFDTLAAKTTQNAKKCFPLLN